MCAAISSPADNPASVGSYRPDIDGLRTVSVAIVVGYHAAPSYFPGGFVGVDVFFVISGFLISRIIFGELATRSFSLAEFYRRRIRRIFPALVLVLAATYAVGWLVLLPPDFVRLGNNLLGGAGFFSNFVLLGSQGYFERDSVTNPLLHLWSLGIEEQFYIVWPALLIALGRYRTSVILIATIALASFAINLAWVSSHQAAAFYSPLARTWELMAGALLAVGGRSIVQKIPTSLRALAGAALICIALATLDSRSTFPGWAALLPVAGAVLLLDSRGSWINRVVLGHPVMTYVGRISYPLYLWHWPVLCLLRIVRNDSPTVLEVVLAVLLSIALAAATYRWIEQPIRHRAHAVIGLCTAMVALALVAIVTIRFDGFNIRFPQQVQEIASISTAENSGLSSPCFQQAPTLPDRQATCVEKGSGPLLILWGDSTAAALYPGLKQAQPVHGYRIGQLSAGSCAPIVASRDPLVSPMCQKLNDGALQIIADTKPDIILLQAHWRDVGDFDGLRQTLLTLKTAGIRHVVVLGPVPTWRRSLPFLLVNAYRMKRSVPARLQTGTERESEQKLAQTVAAGGAIYISAWDALCDENGCMTMAGPSAQDVVAADTFHLTSQGARLLIDRIVPQLFR